jgi:predicted GNAT family N-acyltransferase
MLEQQPGVARIGRMAVNRMLRGSGVGRQVLQSLLSAATARGDREAVLHAQRSALQFYLGMGFAPRGEEFEEAGIPHIEMARPLARA